MQATFTSQQQTTANIHQQKAAESEQRSTPYKDHRPQTSAQAQLMQDIDNSPKMAMQRKEHEQIFGTTQPAQMMEEEELMQGKFEQPVQLMEEEELLQGKFTQPAQLMEEEELMQGKFNNPSPVQKKAENGLPSDLNTNLESTLNSDFSGVNVHTNSDTAVQMNALAYAQGNDVHFAPGQFKPNTASGQQLIGHEFAHVVQQAEGRVKPTTEVNGMPVNDNKGLETEADKIGEKVARM